MLVNFSVSNFGSIKEKQTLSFEADKDTHLEDYYVIHAAGKRLLKLGLIYGANASGKTTVLKALDFLVSLATSPETKKTDELKFYPFLFDMHTKQQSSYLSAEFVSNGIRYFYEVEFNAKFIVNEALYSYNPNKALVFKRSTGLADNATSIVFGSKVKVAKTDKKVLEANTLWNNTVLGGFLKTNIVIPALSDALDWFSKYSAITTPLPGMLAQIIAQNVFNQEVRHDTVLEILKKADFNIDNFYIKKKEKPVPHGLLDLFEQENALPSHLIAEARSRPHINNYKINFVHNIKGELYNLPFEEESEGTQRYFELAGVLGMLVSESVIVSVDELESSLHPDLFNHFILSFLVNSKQSQLLATTHNREILDDKHIYRKDAIWFTEKVEDGGTKLYSLFDFDTSVIRDSSNVLNLYKAGRLGGVPNLNDYYIDLNYEEEAK